MERSMERKPFYFKTNFWLLALVLIIGAAQMLRLSDIPVKDIARQYWPLVFVATAIFQLVSTRYRDLSSSLILLFIGIVLTLFNTGILTPEVVKLYWQQSLKNLFGPIFKGQLNLTGWFKLVIGV